MLQSCRCRWHWPPIPHRVPPATFILNQGSGYATRSPLRKRTNSQPARAPPPRSNNTDRIGITIPVGTSILTDDDARRLAQQCISQNPLYGAVAQALAGHVSNSLLYRAVVLVNLGLETRANHRDIFSPAAQREVGGHLSLCALPLDAACNVGRRLLLLSANRGAYETGWMILFCASASGHHEATIELGVEYEKLLAAKTSLGNLRAGYPTTREQLQKLAESGNLQAATLEAEFAVIDHGLKQSLQYWHTAVNMALDQPVSGSQSRSRLVALSKPWLGLAALQYTKFGDLSAANSALRRGMAIDDADAFALFTMWNSPSPEDDLQAQLEWINAATKAAASGDVASLVHLGRDFAEHPPHPSLKSVVDERQTDLWSLLSSWIKPAASSGTGSSPENLSKAGQAIAAYAYDARTPTDRIDRAVKWLTIAAKHKSIQALLLLAVLRSRRYIFQAHNISLPYKHFDEQTDRDVITAAKDAVDLADADPHETAYYPDKTSTGSSFIWRKGLPSRFFDLGQVTKYLEEIADYGEARATVLASDASTSAQRSEISPIWYSRPDIAELNEESWETTLGAAVRLARAMDMGTKARLEALLKQQQHAAAAGKSRRHGVALK